MQTSIKEYKPMGYLITYGDAPTVYPIPMENINTIMSSINSATPPKYLDLRRFGYGRESVSMIRWAKAYDETKGKVERWILHLHEDLREDVRSFIKDRRSKNQKVTIGVLKQYVFNVEAQQV